MEIKESRKIKSNTIKYKWKINKKSVLIGLLFISILMSIVCLIAYNVVGSYVAEDGKLEEAFAFIPLAWFFTLTAVILSIVLGISSLVKHNKSKQ